MTIPDGKVIDISSGKVELIDKPIELKAGEAPLEANPTEEKKEEEPVAETKKEEPTPETKADEKPTETKKEEKPAEEAKTPDFAAYLKEKYEIDSEEDLGKILKYNQSVKEELEAEKKKEPTYKSEKEKKIAEFLKPYDLDRLNEGLETAATIMGMDIEKIDERRALEEAFILNNTELTREEAKKLYNREYRKRYEPKEDDYDEKSDYEEEKILADIQKKKDVAQARKFLSTKKEELKFKEPEKKEEPTKKDTEISKETIGGYSSQIHKVLDDGKGKKFDSLEFVLDEKDPTAKIKIPFTEAELKDIKNFAVDYLRNPMIYDDTKKIPNFEPLAHVKLIATALFGDRKFDEAVKAAFTHGKTLRAEQLAGLKPDKESKGKGEEGIPSIDDQFRKLAAEKAKSQQKR